MRVSLRDLSSLLPNCYGITRHRRVTRVGLIAIHSRPRPPTGGVRSTSRCSASRAGRFIPSATRFQNTNRAVVDGLKVDPDEIISIDPRLPELAQLVQKLSQPTYSLNSAGKVIVDKKPDGTASPDR
jgi:hypothetical protein